MDSEVCMFNIDDGLKINDVLFLFYWNLRLLFLIEKILYKFFFFSTLITEHKKIYNNNQYKTINKN